MRLAIGVAVGLLFGLIIGFASMTFFNERAITNPQKADTQTSNTQMMASYVCQWNGGTRESALVIKGDAAGAKELIFPWRTDGDRFRIDETTDLHYIATDIEEKKSKIAVSTLDLNRVTGDLYVTNRFTPKALQIMVALCEKKLQPQDCNQEMERLGGSKSDCIIFLETSCKRWLEGNNFVMQAGYSCREAKRRF
jgi:hypothetical protein